MARPLGNPIGDVFDGENQRVEFDIAFSIKGDLPAIIDSIRNQYGEAVCLLPLSGASSAGDTFRHLPGSGANVIGLRFDPPIEPRVRLGSVADLTALALDEIIIDRDNWQVCAGASVTLNQLNQALADQLGQACKVPGADLTSYMYAAAGATFMTGGMGPQRRYFSDSVVEAAIFDGSDTSALSGSALSGYAGTYGWSGIVTAVRCVFYRFPDHETAFAIPVSHQPEQLAGLLQHLGPCTFLDLRRSGVISQRDADSVILGLEHVSLESMQPMLRDSQDPAMLARARALQQKCIAAGADGLIFVNGFSNLPMDEFLFSLVDEVDASHFTIAGIDLEHTEVFQDGEEMRALREAIPYAARMQQPTGKLVYKNHSDANIRLDCNRIDEVMRQLWTINNTYVNEVEAHFAGDLRIDGEILVYGHLNPFGVDPHNRVTMSSDDEAAYRDSKAYLIAARERYYRALADLCDQGGASFIGGEKTADSEQAIFAALGGSDRAPTALRQRFRQQADRIRRASPLLNWRAPPPYV